MAWSRLVRRVKSTLSVGGTPAAPLPLPSTRPMVELHMLAGNHDR